MNANPFLEKLRAIPQQHGTFVGVDSDGCVFDTPTLKLRRYFHPMIIEHWQLEKCADALNTCAEWVNLGSRYRGSNRFAALLRTFDHFVRYPGVRESGIRLPSLDSLRAYVHSGLPLGVPSLRAEVERTGDAMLASVLAWSLEVSRRVDTEMQPVPPFPHVREALAAIAAGSDMAVVSQTPVAAVEREWKANGIDGFAGCIAGQEFGPKAGQLLAATDGRYPRDRVLMIGDAYGDLEAAREAGVSFFPIYPSEEEASWKQFLEEAYPRFLSGTFDTAYQSALIQRFETLLPTTPPWEE